MTKIGTFLWKVSQILTFRHDIYLRLKKVATVQIILVGWGGGVLGCYGYCYIFAHYHPTNIIWNVEKNSELRYL